MVMVSSSASALLMGPVKTGTHTHRPSAGTRTPYSTCTIAAATIGGSVGPVLARPSRLPGSRIVRVQVRPTSAVSSTSTCPDITPPVTSPTTC
jgi:hypothetical protein